MAIYLDTGNVKTIEKFLKMGLVRGVTTNPTILLKEGVTGGMSAIKKRSIEIAKLIHPYPLSVEVTTNDVAEMKRQAEDFASWNDNIVVKITVHGPQGEIDSMQVVHELEKQDIRVNVTAMMSAQQCFLAALAGASYVSILAGRVNNMGYNSVDEIKTLRGLLDRFGLKAQIIAASTREILNVLEWLVAGAHIVTVVPDFLEKMLVHPYSKETVQMFLDDARKAETQLRS